MLTGSRPNWLSGECVRVLDKKLFRDVWRIKVQALAIALVMACGVATIILAAGALRSVENTREAFYERYRFAHVFTSATKAPRHLLSRIQSIPGVATVELRLVYSVLLDIAGMQEPGTGQVVSLPDNQDSILNQLYLRTGRLPLVDRPHEVVVLESFAQAHGFVPGDTFQAILNAHKHTLTIVGVALSPEFIYTIGPGDMVPDERRYGVLYMRSSAVSNLFDMSGAFNNAVLTTLRGTDIQSVIDELDRLLKPFGSFGAYARKDQLSNSFLDNELRQLRGTVAVVPPVFLLISAFLVNMILSRLIALEREQIGLLKAMGYGSGAITWHYAKLVLMIAMIGVIIGSVAGTWFGISLTTLYGEFFKFPFLIFSRSVDLYLIAILVTFIAALAGAAKAIWQTASLSPAVAMQAPVPKRYRRFFPTAAFQKKRFSGLSVMALRHMLRWPVRTALTIFGTAISVSVLVSSLFAYDSIDFMIDTIFFKSNRQDATLVYTNDVATTSVQDVRALPGVMSVEPFRQSAIVLRHRQKEKRVQLIGMRNQTDLSRILDFDFDPMALPPTGIVLSDRLAQLLDLNLGDWVDVEILNKNSVQTRLQVTALANSFIGLSAYMDLDAMHRFMLDGRRYSGVQVRVDENAIEPFYSAIKTMPRVAGVSLLRLSLKSFRATIEQNISMMSGVYVVLAVIITFGVIYNSARIQLSERARELASLRVFGFTRGEVTSVLLTELGIIILVAQPIGWLLGYVIAAAVAQGFESDLFRIPLIINLSTYAVASLVVMLAAIASALIVSRRINHLDLVRVLKTRE